jgi:hypothetical protein
LIRQLSSMKWGELGVALGGEGLRWPTVSCGGFVGSFVEIQSQR